MLADEDATLLGQWHALLALGLGSLTPLTDLANGLPCVLRVLRLKAVGGRAVLEGGIDVVLPVAALVGVGGPLVGVRLFDGRLIGHKGPRAERVNDPLQLLRREVLQGVLQLLQESRSKVAIMVSSSGKLAEPLPDRGTAQRPEKCNRRRRSVDARACNGREGSIGVLQLIHGSGAKHHLLRCMAERHPGRHLVELLLLRAGQRCGEDAAKHNCHLV
mmetsp:Transcript_39565/g.123412  ORF Transcript_39565/g.123412 Transcript_39565/m.123412 type:complete len:217 (-) Transcript_39565:64-714(-)